MREALRRWTLPLIPGPWRRSARLLRWLDARLERRVLSGPFRGLRYVDRSFSSAYWPKLFGTYEIELHGVLEELLANPFDLVVVPGAAEGYYAVGAASRLSGTRVVAWEANPEARAAALELAQLNGVADRVEVRGICDARELAGSCSDPGAVLVIADVDGGEAVLLDPAIVPGLGRASIVVEVHDCFVPGLTDLLERRFAASHDVRRVPARPRSFGDAPDIGVPPVFRGAFVQLLSERRPPGNDWLVMTPKAGA